MYIEVDHDTENGGESGEAVKEVHFQAVRVLCVQELAREIVTAPTR